jgi:potassium/sodium efflux P-type ATPase
MSSSIASAWSMPPSEVITAVDTDLAHGLSTDVAARRLVDHGRNEITARPSTSWIRRLGQQFTDPLVILLLAAIAISIVAWWSDGANGTPLEAIVIAAIVVLNAGIGFWQELQAVAAVEALRKMSATHSTVIRDGRTIRVVSSDLVVGDVVELSEGDAVGADCRLVEAVALHIAEAALTGESTAVTKTGDEAFPPETPLAERGNMAFSGTAVTRGRGVGVVVATGFDTQIGRIAELLDAADDRDTPLQREIRWLGRQLGIAVVVLSAIVVAAVIVSAEDRSFGAIIDALLVGVSMAVAAVPEGLPAILSVVLALGVQRMARERAIVKRLSSVETLGSATVICTDKTGTLTHNEMTIVRVVTPTATVEVTGTGYHPIGHLEIAGQRVTDRQVLDEVESVLRSGSLANDASLDRDGDETDDPWVVHGDPTEAAFLVAEAKLCDASERRRRFRRVAEIPFTSERRRMTTVHHDNDADTDGGEFVLVSKGAPDVMLDRCSHERVGDRVVTLTDARRVAIAEQVDRLAQDALRTIAVAYRSLDHRPGTRTDHDLDERYEEGLVHLGVVGILDPPRPEAAAAIAAAHAAGIRVIMLTGDHPVTAARIGSLLGIEGEESGTSGQQLDRLDDDAFDAAIRTHSVFARVEPEHKLRIVERLQADGQIVAMTGDGVNDAPALHRADIGVAMGDGGTEVAKEAADMILADDNFATILRAVREGREIFADIRKVLRYLLASNGGEVLVMVVGVLAAGALGLRAAGATQAVPLLATQILWINLLTDGTLALALGVDPSVDDVMSGPPRRIGERVIDRDMLERIVLLAIVSAVSALAALDLGLPGGLLGGEGDLATARTMAFSTLVIGQVFDAYNSRSPRISAFHRPFENRALWVSALVTILLQLAVVHLGFMQTAFDTAALGIREWAIVVALASSVLWADEARKWYFRHRS